MQRFRDLLSVIGQRRPVFVQTHDFPDCDAVASAFGIQRLLGEEGVPARIVHAGDIQRDSLRRMIKEIGIEVEDADSVTIAAGDPIVIVDACKGSRNVRELPGDEIAVIDHHEVTSPESVTFIDIRPDLGACSTLIYSYWQETGREVPRGVATAFMIGINMDTALLTRQVSVDDIQAYAHLYTHADVRLENSILRSSIQTKDLSFYLHALSHIQIERGLAFCWFPNGCNQNLLGILGDFFITLEEAEFVALCARNDGIINVSARSEREEWHASRVVQAALMGIGFGGGHAHMAGGIVRQPETVDGPRLRDRFLSVLSGPVRA